MNTPTVTRAPRRLWQDDNGRIACAEHSGGYLAAAVKLDPDSPLHQTPIGTFLAVTAETVDVWDGYAAALGPLGCEDCGAPPLV